RARISATRVESGKPALFPLRDGPADPQFLFVPLGALGGEERRLASRKRKRRDRDLLRSGARLQRRSDDRFGEEVARLFHRALLALSAPPGADSRIPAL